MYSRAVLLSVLLEVVSALDFQWLGKDGVTYWAEETTRYPADSPDIQSQLSTDGFGYFTVGGSIDWPEFNATINLPESDLKPGAYVAAALKDTIVIAKAYQLQHDPAIAFMSGATPAVDSETSFNEHVAGLIPVPPATGEGPLAGLRFAVKDIFHVEGLKTSGGSRSYYDAYGPQNFTTEVVETSLAAGAQLVGKVKTIAFALGTPLNGWEVDYQDPWNMRGDGYQSTGGSSSGSGAALVAYDWLDFTIGSDTGGSVRFPARLGGFYGYKPTHGVYNLTGILPAIAEQDTPGHMARSPSIFTKVGRVWLEGKDLESPEEFPSTLQYWTDEAPLTQSDAEAMKLDFFEKVEEILQVNTTSVNLTASFREHVINESFDDYYSTVYFDQNSPQGWDEIGAPLVELYAAQNDGAYPPLDPAVNISWADGVNETIRARYDEAVHRREQYATWFNEHILPNSSDTCTSAIVAHSLHIPPSTVKVDQMPFAMATGFWNGMQASYAGFPEIVVPIGQVQYESPFTRKTEWWPVTVAFAAAKGCDAVLFDLVDKLAEAGLLREVMTGKVAFPVEE